MIKYYYSVVLYKNSGLYFHYSYYTMFFSGIYWHRNRRRHRDNDPAIEFEDGSKAWYNNGNYIKNEKN